MGQSQVFLWAKIRVVQALAHFLVLHICDVYGGLKLFAQNLGELVWCFLFLVSNLITIICVYAILSLLWWQRLQ